MLWNYRDESDRGYLAMIYIIIYNHFTTVMSLGVALRPVCCTGFIALAIALG